MYMHATVLTTSSVVTLKCNAIYSSTANVVYQLISNSFLVLLIALDYQHVLSKTIQTATCP
jgi:hypothetical protein